jgi:hypothetical protein
MTTLKSTDLILGKNFRIGENIRYIINKTSNCNVIINEKSEVLKTHLENNVLSIDKQRVSLSMGDSDSIDYKKSDLIISGVFYGEFLRTIKNKGKEISDSLGKDGLLLVQSGMPENLFALSIMDSTIFPDIQRWDWYSNDLSLDHYFKNVSSFHLNGEIITLASNNLNKINEIKLDLNDKIKKIEI